MLRGKFTDNKNKTQIIFFLVTIGLHFIFYKSHTYLSGMDPTGHTLDAYQSKIIRKLCFKISAKKSARNTLAVI
jgi:hypothetical protein